MYSLPRPRWTLTFHCRAYESRVLTSKIERVEPAAGRFGSTPGGAGRPSFSSRLLPYAVGVGVNAVDCRNGGFCAFDEEVPPGVKFQKTPKPPRMTVFASPARSYAKPKRGPRSRFE